LARQVGRAAQALAAANFIPKHGPNGDITEKVFSGGLNWNEPPFKVTASNITQDKETGIGDYTDAELREVLRKGIKRNGVPVAMVMPSGLYEIMTDRDLDAVIAYLRTIKPIKNTVPDPVYRMAQGHPIPPASHDERQGKEGFYLVTIAHCMECHTPMDPHGREFASRLGAGGFAFPGRWGAFRCRATSPQARKMASATGPTMKSSVSPQWGYHYYSTVSTDDLDAVVAYLRTVPAKD
jgi:mono/diheme cytochrome c family protein